MSQKGHERQAGGRLTKPGEPGKDMHYDVYMEHYRQAQQRYSGEIQGTVCTGLGGGMIRSWTEARWEPTQLTTIALTWSHLTGSRLKSGV